MWCISTLVFSCNATYLSFPPKYLSHNGVCSNLHFKVTMLTMGCYITNCTHLLKGKNTDLSVSFTMKLRKLVVHLTKIVNIGVGLNCGTDFNSLANSFTGGD